MTTRNATIPVIVSLDIRDGKILWGHGCIRLLSGLEGGELGSSKSKDVLYAALALISSEGNSYKDLRGKIFGDLLTSHIRLWPVRFPNFDLLSFVWAF